MRFETVYPGTPTPQGRARHTKQGRTYTPAVTRAAQESLKQWLWAEAHREGYEPAKGPVRLVLAFTFPMPRSWPQWKQAWALQHDAPHTSKPDADNLAKLVKDAANGVLWCDDSQVAHITVAKRYGPVPQTVIACEELPGIPESKRAAQDLVRLVG